MDEREISDGSLSGLLNTEYAANPDNINQIFDLMLPIIDENGYNLNQYVLSNYNLNQQNNQLNEQQPLMIIPKIEPLAEVQQDVCNEDYAGPHNFDVFIDPHHGNKSPWVYSSPLRKVFISANHNFPVDFKWERFENENLFVRATPIFGNAQNVHDLVVRCITHAQSTDTTNIDFEPHIWDHILRCSNKNARYEGNKKDKKRLSVVLPLGNPEIGSDTVRQFYQFVCKNSCPGGMNRRPLEVVYTLEDQYFNIKGRKRVSVRICSCPKRDKEKEEREYHNKGASEQPGKKRKLEKKPASFSDAGDTKEYEINLKIIGKNNAKAVVKYAHDLMAGEMIRHGSDQPYKKCLHDINKLRTPSE